jgi:hypothetical protein
MRWDFKLTSISKEVSNDVNKLGTRRPGEASSPMNTKGTSIFRREKEGALINVTFIGSLVPTCKCT